jgi:EAL domain-containing protein (putative c-di-GMP-specific phosphodiesterase class I)
MTRSAGWGSRDLFVGRGRRARPSGHKKMGGATLLNGVISGVDEPEHVREHREELIRATIHNRSLETVFQPIVDLKTGSAVGAEALARFSELPIRPPDVWFADAASLGLGVKLEMAALRLALEQLRRLPPGLYLSLNASVETIMSEEFRNSLDDVPAERVVLELTEHTEVLDYELFERSVEHLRSRGVRLAVDDAGAGYASFRHILNLRPDVIKLDIGLTRGIDGDPARRALGAALLTFGLDAYNASIVAEGIETEGEFTTLRALGCPFGQGFFLGRPGRLRLERPKPATVEALWRPTPHASQQHPPLEEHATAAGTASRAQAQPPRSAPHDPVPEAGTPDPGNGHGVVPKKPRRDDHAELLALVAEIRDRDVDGGDRLNLRSSPLKALRVG